MGNEPTPSELIPSPVTGLPPTVLPKPPSPQPENESAWSRLEVCICVRQRVTINYESFGQIQALSTAGKKA